MVQPFDWSCRVVFCLGLHGFSSGISMMPITRKHTHPFCSRHTPTQANWFLHLKQLYFRAMSFSPSFHLSSLSLSLFLSISLSIFPSFSFSLPISLFLPFPLPLFLSFLIYIFSPSFVLSLSPSFHLSLFTRCIQLSKSNLANLFPTVLTTPSYQISYCGKITSILLYSESKCQTNSSLNVSRMFLITPNIFYFNLFKFSNKLNIPDYNHFINM